MGKQRLHIRLLGLLICAATVAGILSTQNAASSALDAVQAIPPEITALPTPLPRFTTLSVEVLAQYALDAARINGFGGSLTLDDLDLSQAVMTTYDQLIRYDGDFVHYYGILNPEVGVPDNRPVAIIPISQVVPDGTGESTYQRVVLFFLYADNGDLLHTVEMGMPVISPNTTATPVPLVEALPPRDENGVLPLDYLLNKAYWTAKMGMPEDFTMADMDMSQMGLTTYRQYRAFERGVILEKPPKTGPDMLRRPVFVMAFTGGDFPAIYLRPPEAKPTKFDKMIVQIWADTGQNFAAAYGPVGGGPLRDLSPLKEYGLPFYIPTATPTP